MEQMEYWVEVRDRGFPFRFEDIEEFQNFGKDLKTGLKEIDIPIHDVRVQGSSVRTPNAKDVDVVAMLKEENFISVLKKRFSKRITKTVNGETIKVDISNLSTKNWNNSP